MLFHFLRDSYFNSSLVNTPIDGDSLSILLNRVHHEGGVTNSNRWNFFSFSIFPISSRVSTHTKYKMKHFRYFYTCMPEYLCLNPYSIYSSHRLCIFSPFSTFRDIILNCYRRLEILYVAVKHHDTLKFVYIYDAVDTVLILERFFPPPEERSLYPPS